MVKLKSKRTYALTHIQTNTQSPGTEETKTKNKKETQNNPIIISMEYFKMQHKARTYPQYVILGINKATNTPTYTHTHTAPHSYKLLHLSLRMCYPQHFLLSGVAITSLSTILTVLAALGCAVFLGNLMAICLKISVTL